jgi:hypothetical protein
MTEKSAKSAAKSRARTTRPKAKARKPTQAQIATRAYFIHLDEIHLDEADRTSSATGCAPSAS